MSLILEALRKSEAERRRGQVPGLHAELPPAVQSTRSRRPAWLWLLVLAIIAIVVAFAMTWPMREPANVAETGVDRSSRSVDRRDTSTPAVEAAPSVIEPVRAPPRIAGSTAAAEPPAPSTTAKVESASPTPPPLPPKPRPESNARPPRDAGGSRAAATPSPATTPPTERRPVASSTQPASPVPPPSAAPAAPSPGNATANATDKPALLRLSDLAAAERRALPPLQVSMHMWAPTSARRFAIIDGARVNEGDRLGDAVVEAITRDGVVLAWRGRRVHIPIH